MYSKTLLTPFSHVTLYSFSGSTLCLQINVTLEPLSTYFFAIKSTSTSDCPSVGGKGNRNEASFGHGFFVVVCLVLGLAGCRPLVNNSHSTGPLAYSILINPLALWSRSKGLFIQIYIQDEYLRPCCVLGSHCSQDIGAFNMPCHVINNTRVRAGKLSIVTEQIARQTLS